MLAALGPRHEIAWVEALDAGPTEEPIRDQLVAHAKVMADYFHELQAGFGVLQAAGIDPSRAPCPRDGGSAPERAYRALVGWIERAQRQGRLAACDADTLASTILGALQGWALSTRVCGAKTSCDASGSYVERFIALLWAGIGGTDHERAGARR